MNSQALISVSGLKKYFYFANNYFKKQAIKALDGVSFNIYKGTTLGLIGESGSGKTTLGRVLVRLYNPTAGQVFFKGKNLLSFTRSDNLQFARQVQMIFQNPFSALNPRMTVDGIIGEGLDIHRLAEKGQRSARIEYLLERVGLNGSYLKRYPHELSSGQRQRVAIARVLAVQPEFIVCDEPVSSLDISIQWQILELLIKMKDEQGLTYLFISHDLNTVKYMSDYVGVMYLGKLVEFGPAEKLFASPKHPYTRSLVNDFPHLDNFKIKAMEKKQQPEFIGTQPGATSLVGCLFQARCPDCRPVCKELAPELSGHNNEHVTACHYY